MTPELKASILKLIKTGNRLARDFEVSEEARDAWDDAQEDMMDVLLGVDEETPPRAQKGPPSPQQLQRKARTCVRIAELEGITDKAKVEQRAAQLMEFEEEALVEKEQALRSCSS